MTRPTTAPLDVTGRPLRLRDVDLDTFLRPRSVAVIGASDTAGKPNTLMTRALKEFSDKYGAAFYPVHPVSDEVFGARVYRTIAEVPQTVDLVAILTGAAVDTFEEVQAAGAKFAVIFAAGFSEVGKDGEKLEARLRALVESGDTRLLGPNTNLNAFSEFREDLTFTFPEVRPDGTQLLFEWAGKRAAFNVVVTPSHPLTIARAEAEPFIGKYQWKWEGDTASAGTMELYYANGMLLQRYTPKPDWYPLLQDQPMVRINGAWFIPTIVDKGTVLEMVSDMVFEFTMVNGKPTTLEIRDDKDNLLATGKRM